MLKALLMASVIIGAFLFQPAAYSQESSSNPCPFGGDLLDGMCTMAAPLKETKTIRCNSTTYGVPGVTLTIPTSSSAGQACVDASLPLLQERYTSNTSICNVNLQPHYDNPRVEITYNTYSYSSCNETTNKVTSTWFPYPNLLSNQNGYQCPPDGSVGKAFTQGPFVTESGQNLCFYPAAIPDNDNECPPGTVGDCDQPPEEPECSIAGNGMKVCPADPNEKCSSYQHEGKTFYDCPSNCGFIQDQFFCTTESDSDGEIPDMSKCFKVATGWACPPDSPTPDDNIDNPDKPLPDMNKGDFKEVNRGIETRLDATNQLLGELTGIGAANNQALADLNAKLLAANGFLRNIEKNTADTAKNTGDIKDALTGDGLELDDNHQGLIGGALGITGDESIDDLTKEEITLDSFRSEFQWSVGGGSCPAPRQINILGASFHMDWQPYCEAFAVVSHFILAAAYLFAGFIAFGGRK